ncbi:MAG TPA: T9SS type A sorting domain-containing protein [Bacteroidales bacterium]
MSKKTNVFRKFLFGIILFIMGTNLNAQPYWENVLEEPDPAFFTDIWFVEGADGMWQTGWVLDYNGKIFKTEDAGETWTTTDISSYSVRLSNVCFVDETIGYLCDYDGNIFKSTDGGATWTEQYSSGTWFSSISFKDALNGIVSGTPNMYTSDGGTTWTQASGGDSDESYGYAAYAAGDTYYSTEIGLFDYGEIGRTTNNGQSWNNIVSGITFLPNYIACYGANHIMTGGANEIVYFSHDAGVTWEQRTLDDGIGDAAVFAWFDADTVWAAGSDLYKSTDGGYNWVADTIFGLGTHREIFVTATNVTYVANDIFGDSQTIWRKVGGLPLNADFEANPTEVCAGSSVDFTDLSYFPPETWSWSFPGGTPSSSTEQNPTVTYSTAGVYSVTLTVTLTGASESTMTKTDYIHVVELAEQPDMPAGDVDICNGNIYTYTVPEVTYGTTYIWELSPEDAGTLTSDMNEATINTSFDWSGDFTLKVKVNNACGDSPWSDAFEGTLHASPEVFSLNGGGAFCEGSEGVEITMSGSESGINYVLYLDGVTTGIIVAGTGNAVSFGLVNVPGFYEVLAASDFCDIFMPDQIEVSLEFAPAAPGQVAGPEVACNVATTDYTSTGSADADSYVWELSPEEAGTISGSELEATVSWNAEYSGTAIISLAGVNDCGTGEASTLEVAVNSNFVLTIDGADLTCDFQSESYSVEQNESFTYTWAVTGGTITDGQGSSEITVSWGGEGNGSVSVEVVSSDGCTGTSEDFPVMIDDCTGLQEIGGNDALSVYPNPAQNQLNVVYNSATAKQYSLQIFNTAGVIVYSEKMSGNGNEISTAINISELKPGMYFIRINSGNTAIANSKFIKE